MMATRPHACSPEGPSTVLLLVAFITGIIIAFASLLS